METNLAHGCDEHEDTVASQVGRKCSGNASYGCLDHSKQEGSTTTKKITQMTIDGSTNKNSSKEYRLREGEQPLVSTNQVELSDQAGGHVCQGENMGVTCQGRGIGEAGVRAGVGGGTGGGVDRRVLPAA